MSNPRPAFGQPIYSDVNNFYAPVYSGGNFVSPLLVTNLQTRYLHEIARTLDLNLLSTQFDVDLIIARAIGIVAIPKHNFSTLASFRWRAWSTHPIASWARVGDADWTATGTPTRTYGGGVPAVNGIYLDLVGDDTAGAMEDYHRTVAFTGNGDKVISFLVARFSPHGFHQVRIVDTTTSTTRLNINIDFQATTPVVTALTGTVVSTTAEDTGFRIVVKASGIIAANTNVFTVAPAGNNTLDFASFQIGDIDLWDIDTLPLVYDSGFVPAWPSGVTPEDAYGINVAAYHVLPTLKTARYWRCEVNDVVNPIGYLDMSRAIVAGIWYPGQGGMDYGAKFGLETETTRATVDGGSAFYDIRPNRRSFAFTLSNLSETEAIDTAWRVQRQLGMSGQCFFVFDVGESYTRGFERAFLCVPRELSPIEHQMAVYHSKAWGVLEEI